MAQLREDEYIVPDLCQRMKLAHAHTVTASPAQRCINLRDWDVRLGNKRKIGLQKNMAIRRLDIAVEVAHLQSIRQTEGKAGGDGCLSSAAFSTGYSYAQAILLTELFKLLFLILVQRILNAHCSIGKNQHLNISRL